MKTYKKLAKHRREQRRRERKAKAERAGNRLYRAERLLATAKRGDLRPVHPRDHYWFAVGMLHARVGERATGQFPLQEPTGGGGSYWGRYRAMYEAGKLYALGAAA